MGEFAFVDPEKKMAAPKEQQQTVLTLDYFKAHPKIEIPRVTAADRRPIEGDVLSKIIVILQTTWFIVQCIALMCTFNFSVCNWSIHNSFSPQTLIQSGIGNYLQVDINC